MENKFLVDKYKDKVTVLENGSVIADVELWDEMSKLIKKNKFDYLMSITSYDLETDNNLGLAYNFHSTKTKKYLEVRLEFNSDVEIRALHHYGNCRLA